MEADCALPGCDTTTGCSVSTGVMASGEATWGTSIKIVERTPVFNAARATLGVDEDGEEIPGRWGSWFVDGGADVTAGVFPGAGILRRVDVLVGAGVLFGGCWITNGDVLWAS